MNVGTCECRVPGAGVVSKVSSICELTIGEDSVTKVISHTESSQPELREGKVYECLRLSGGRAHESSNGSNISCSVCLQDALEGSCIINVEEDELLLGLLHAYAVIKASDIMVKGEEIIRHTEYRLEYSLRASCHSPRRSTGPGPQ